MHIPNHGPDSKPSLWKTGIKVTLLSRPMRAILPIKLIQSIINRLKLWSA